MLAPYELDGKLLKRHHCYTLDVALADLLIRENVATLKNAEHVSFFNKMLKIKYK